MKKNTLLTVFIIGILFIIIIYSFSGGETKEQYIDRIKEERVDKNRFMKTSSTSPFREQNIPFGGLTWFEPDPDYNINARFDPIDIDEYVMLPTNDNLETRYRKYGYATFKLQDRENKLLILELADGSENDGHLFIPFGDETSASETYGAGRYLDIKHNEGDVIVQLDFNQAYNPYCAYSEEYSCPLPPRENLLAIPIKAGEKTYK